MRRALVLSILAALGVETAFARPVETGVRRMYFRAATPEARARIAPHVTHELPGGILRAVIPEGTFATLADSPGLTVVGPEVEFSLVPIEVEQEVPGGEAPRHGTSGEARTCFLPRFLQPVGWGVRTMYEDPGLTQPSGGAGVRVAVLDGGVAPHPDVARRLVRCLDMTSMMDGPEVCEEPETLHGTGVASVIAADGGADGLGMIGMAPEARIYSYRVCESGGGCFGAYVAAGIYAAIADSVNIINLSLTGGGHDEVVEAAVAAARARNILVIAAAGNRPFFSWVGFPAAYTSAVSVGAIREDRMAWPLSVAGLNDGDYVREYREVEVSAPGAGVLAALKVRPGQSCYVLGNGTSLAAPLVSGLAAKLWNGSATQTRARLQLSARLHDVHIAGDDTTTGFGVPTVAATAHHRINATAGAGGKVSPGGPVLVPTGASKTFAITPSSACFVVQNVWVDGVPQGPGPSYTFSDVRADHTIHATFSPLGPFTIQASAGVGGTITPSGTTAVACGGSQSYTIATLGSCYVIQDVKVNGVSVGPRSTYAFSNVRADHTIEATFRAISALPGPFTITATAGPGGTITPGGATVVGCGTSRIYTIAPLGACYAIEDVKVDGVSVGPVASYTFAQVGADHTIEATFRALTAEPGPFTITATAGPGGTITPGGATVVACGNSLAYAIATAGSCYEIQNVRVDGVSVGPRTSYTFANVRADHTIEATFVALSTEPGPFTITASAGPGGTITPSGGRLVPCGSSANFTIATLGPCFEIEDVKVDGVSVGPRTSYTFSRVTAHHTIEATFRALSANPGPFNITATAGLGGTITPSGVTIVGCGNGQTYSIRPDACQEIEAVRVDGVSVGPRNTYTFSNVREDHTIEATFRPHAGFTIDATAGNGGSISPSGVTTVPCGGSRTFTISPAFGCWETKNVLVDGSSVGKPSIYTFSDVRAHHSIHATFGTPTVLAYITAAANSGGRIEPAGTVAMGCEGIQNFTITPNACHAIENVRVNGTSLGPVTHYTFTGATGSQTIVAWFRALDSFTITAIAGPGGTITPAGATSVPCRAYRTYLIRPADNCHVVEDVKLDGVSLGPVSVHTFPDVQADHTIEATFSRRGPFTIGSEVGPGGTVEPAGEISVPCGESRTFTIAPADACHVIQYVAVDGTLRRETSTVTFTNVIEDHWIEARFARRGPFTIEATAGEGGTITPAGTASVPCGESRTYTFAPAEACRVIGDVQVDGASVGAVTGYTFKYVQSNHTIAMTSAPSGLGLAETHTGASFGGVADGAIDLTVEGGVPPYAFAWSNGAISEDLSRLEAGAYEVVVTDAQGCADSLAVAIANLGPAEPALSRPSPNPARGPVQFRYGTPGESAIRLSVLDLQGREVALLAHGTRPAGWAWATWNGDTDRGRAAAGIYFVQLQAGGRRIVHRFALVR